MSEEKQYKQYIGISRDHSASMSSIRRAAQNDYNQTITAIKDAAAVEGIDTVVSVVKCGVGYSASVEREIINSSVAAIHPLTQYNTDGGGTPLYDSVGELIELLEKSPDANEQNVSFVIMVITDGEENCSRKWKTKLFKRIQELQATDRWTFIFRVPRGAKRNMVRQGIPEGNVLEWEQTEKGMQTSTQVTTEAFRGFYAARKSGSTSTRSFYTTDLTEADITKVKAQLIDVSSQVTFHTVSATDAGSQIRDFCEKVTSSKMLKGAAFYQLVKPERKVQDTKQIAIRDLSTGAVYVGPAARDMMGLPHYGNVSVHPGNHGNYEVFIQSTSVNRKLPEGTNVMYWPGVGTAYQEGKSA